MTQYVLVVLDISGIVAASLYHSATCSFSREESGDEDPTICYTMRGRLAIVFPVKLYLAMYG